MVDDNAALRAQVVADLRRLRMSVIEIPTAQEFERLTDDGALASEAPVAIIIDLRLGWSSREDLALDPLKDGISCIERLRNTALTAAAPLIVYSAFIHDDEIIARLRPHQPLILVDKLERPRLKLVIENLPLATPTNRRIAGLKEWLLSGERRLVRLGVIAGALVATIAIIAKFAHLL